LFACAENARQEEVKIGSGREGVRYLRRARMLKLVAAALLAVVAPVAAAAARVRVEPAPQAQVTFLVSGHGYGHGIGMSQWGARGYAEHAWGYRQILRHFYPGTALGPAPLGRVRVLIAEHRRKLAISSAKPFRVRDATGAVYPLEAPALVLDARLRVPIAGVVQPQPLEGPLTFLPAGAPLELGGKPYRGTFTVDARAGRVHCIDTLGVDAYVSGVVSVEMPHDWPAEAQKAQAVAARSYALATIARGATLFDVFADTRSQVYGGIAAETPEGDAAVAATAGQVLLYRGTVAETFFHSSSGGRTADVTEQWPDVQPVPYLVSVADPYDVESTHHDWGPVAFTAKQVAKALKLPAPPLDLTVVRGPSGRAVTVAAVDAAGFETDVRGTDFRFGLHLDSTLVRIGKLALEPPADPVSAGQAAILTGSARGVAAPVLEQRTAGGPWEPGPPLALAPDGSFSVTVRPVATTDFRLTADGGSTGLVQVVVA
jgi:stage II sporulation protein D